MPKVPTRCELPGETILLRSLEPADYKELAEVLNDRITMEHLIQYFGRESWTDEEVAERYDHFTALQEKGTHMTFAVHYRAENRVVGNCGLKDIDLEKRRAEFGIIVHRSVWGTRVAKECHSLVLSYAFDVLGVTLVYFTTDHTNLRMQRFFESKGIQRRDNGDDTKLYYELPVSDWPATKEKLGGLFRN